MTNSCKLDLPLSRISFHNPKPVLAIEVLLYKLLAVLANFVC